MKLTLAIAALLAAARIWLGFNVEPEAFQWVQVYKDSAHLFMGGLAVAWWYGRHDWQWLLFCAMCVLEVTVAILSRI